MDKEEWLERYQKRLRERGVEQSIIDDLSVLEGDMFDEPGFWGTPEESADEELSLWASDG